MLTLQKEVRSPFVIRPYQATDYPALAAVMRASYDYADDDMILPPQQVESLRNLRPNGQMTAWVGNQLVGANLTRIVPSAQYATKHTEAMAADPTRFVEDAHRGNAIYSLDLFVLPAFRSLHIGQALHQHLVRQAFADGFESVIGLSRLSGFHRYQKQFSAEAYVLKVIAGELIDPALSFNLQLGPRVVSVVANCIPRDTKSCGYAVVLQLVNPQLQMAHWGSRIKRHTELASFAEYSRLSPSDDRAAGVVLPHPIVVQSN